MTNFINNLITQQDVILLKKNTDASDFQDYHIRSFNAIKSISLSNKIKQHILNSYFKICLKLNAMEEKEAAQISGTRWMTYLLLSLLKCQCFSS